MLKALLSIKVSLCLLFSLALSAAIATFIENDFGTSTARNMVYDAIWYEMLLAITAVQMLSVIYRSKMILSSRLFHMAFVVILVGAALTRYGGYEAYLNLYEGEVSHTVLSSEQYLQLRLESQGKYLNKEYPFTLAAFGNDFDEVLEFEGKRFSLKVKEVDFIYKQRQSSSIMKVEVSTQKNSLLFELKDTMQALGHAHEKMLDDVKLTLSYGSKPIELPFSIKLEKFVMQHYPGSKMASGYSSFIKVIDGSEGFKHHIFMNNTLSYRGYKFFQSSYTEGLSTLSVNKDPGKLVTYFGYALLFFGLIFNLFDKKSRFNMLRKRVGKAHFILLLSLLPYVQTYAQESADEIYFKNFSKESQEASRLYSRLNVQTVSGLTKSMDTLNREILYKISGKDELYGLNANQFSLGMLTRAQRWKKVKMIRIRSEVLKELLKMKGSYASYEDFFDDGSYKLKKELIKAKARPITLRSAYEKDLLKVDERVNIVSMVYKGTLFNIFIKKGEEKWLNFESAWKDEEEGPVFRREIKSFLDAGYHQDYQQLEKEVAQIESLQRVSQSNLLLSPERIGFELLYNTLSIFSRLTPAYAFLSLLMLTLSFASIFSKSLLYKRGLKVAFYLLLCLFILHGIGLVFRSILAGYVPISNTYESIVFIAFWAAFSGMVFFRKSSLALSASAAMAAIFMFVAHLNAIDPQITNLVPVLNSFWLSIHVSVITSSYGFLALSALLGYFTLVLMLSDKDREIKYLRDINEMSMIIGLFVLIIGNFLGGIWANESWGRYWAWDPKETWTYISILIYVLVLHLRLIKPLNNSYIFSLGSVFAFFSIIMTYFGVNFYLSGKHSYAKADQLIFPSWLYYVLGMILLTAAASAYKKMKTNT